jgi:hypothetical protein
MRLCLCLLVAAVACLAGDPQTTVTLHGKLIVRAGKPTAIETTDHKTVLVDGDPEMRKVLADPRINGFEVQAKGHFTAPDRFLLDPIHTHSMLVNQKGHLKMVTYWCDVCSIRAYTPGPCVCCQRETVLDLRDPDEL